MGGVYDNSVDIWSLGVITYVLLCGYYPFNADSENALFRLIMEGKYSFPEKDWGTISAPAKDFVKSMLALNPEHRPSAVHLLDHSWLREAPQRLVSSARFTKKISNTKNRERKNLKAQ
jgi:calcium/calmodulin-dependent protein kinase I